MVGKRLGLDQLEQGSVFTSAALSAYKPKRTRIFSSR